MTTRTSNEVYGKLNTQFDIRHVQLSRIGYKYEIIKEYGIAVFVARKYGRVRSIAAGTVIHADDFCWENEIKDAKRFMGIE